MCTFGSKSNKGHPPNTEGEIWLLMRDTQFNPVNPSWHVFCSFHSAQSEFCQLAKAITLASKTLQLLSKCYWIFSF